MVLKPSGFCLFNFDKISEARWLGLSQQTPYTLWHLFLSWFLFCFVLFFLFLSVQPAAGLSPGPSCFPKEHLDAVLVDPVGEDSNALDGFISKQEQQWSWPILPELW